MTDTGLSAGRTTNIARAADPRIALATSPIPPHRPTTRIASALATAVRDDPRPVCGEALIVHPDGNP